MKMSEFNFDVRGRHGMECRLFFTIPKIKRGLRVNESITFDIACMCVRLFSSQLCMLVWKTSMMAASSLYRPCCSLVGVSGRVLGVLGVSLSRQRVERVSTNPDLKGRGSGNIVTNAPFRKGQAKDLIYRLSAEERNTLLRELQQLQQVQMHRISAAGAGPEVIVPPTGSQLRAVALYNALPFIGFGFLDNFIMIMAGDYIDMTIGTALGISTLAAAALGNMISDIAGIGSAWYVESIVARFGVVPPPLTPEQIGMMSTRWSINFGRALGVSLGCLLGMFPLLLLTRHKQRSEKQEPPASTN